MDTNLNSLSDTQKKARQDAAKQPLQDADECLQAASLLMDHQYHTHAFQIYKQSLHHLLKSVAGLFQLNIPLENESLPTAAESFRPLSDQLPKVWNKLPKSLEIVQALSKKSKIEGEDLVALENLQKNLLDLLIAYQHQLLKMLRNELQTQTDKAEYKTQRKKNIVRTALVIVPLLILSAVLFVNYQQENPARDYYFQAQLFWKSSTVADFNEDHKKLFKAKVDGQFQDYLLVLEDNVKISGLRLDSVKKRIHEFSLDHIQLLDAQEKVLQHFDFNADESAWKPINAKSQGTPNGTWSLNPRNHDAFILSPDFPEIEVKQIKIRVRHFDKQPFFYWLLGYKGD